MVADVISFPLHGWTRHTDAIQGIAAASWTAGPASAPTILLIHGIGPGTSGVANFEPLLAQLLRSYRLCLVDLIGFGASDKKSAMPFFDVALWHEQLTVVLRRLGSRVHVVGNSVGGALAFRLAGDASVEHQVASVVAIGAPLRASIPTAELRRFWSAPDDKEALALAMRPMTANADMPAPERVAARYRIFENDPAYAAYFNQMLADPEQALACVALNDDDVAAIQCPMLIVHGTLDRACTIDDTALAFMRIRADADLVLFGDCGHNVTAERTADLLNTLQTFMHRTK